ncbi:MAG: hypothetical protein ACI8WB_004191 [Phenylobacterium sp.]|jgi:hypothetical protein
MLELKQRCDVSWDDMARIEDPFFAKTEIEQHFYHSNGVECIWGLTDILETYAYCAMKPDQAALSQVLDGLEHGKFFLLKSNPFSPVVVWQKEHDTALEGRWDKSPHGYSAISLVIDELLASTVSSSFSNTSKRNRV